jgi:hypothetical protein
MQILTYVPIGEVAEWSKAADCKSAGVSLRRFESCPPQKMLISNTIKYLSWRSLSYLYYWMVRYASAVLAGVAQLARASAFQAEGRGFESRLPLLKGLAHVAQPVEHILGKDEVGGSSPPVGSICFKNLFVPKYSQEGTIKEAIDVKAEI